MSNRNTPQAAARSWRSLAAPGAVVLASLLAGVLATLLPEVSWEVGVLAGLMTFLAACIVWMVREAFLTPEDVSETDTLPDAATREEQEAAIAHLASLPHVRQLSDGTLFDCLRGSYIRPCGCGRYSAFHLWVQYGEGRRHGIALVTRGALAQYVALQDAVAAGLTRKGGAA